MRNMIQNVLIGIDLGNETTQISYYNKKDKLPVTLTTVTGTDKYQIPTVVCKKYNSDKWYYGKEALYFSERGEGTLVGDILTKCEEGVALIIEDITYEPYEILSIFFENMLSLTGSYNEPDNISGVMVSCENHTPMSLVCIPKAMKKIGISEKKIFIQTYLESFYYYLLNQKKELWTYDVALFEYKNNEIIGNVLRLNRKVSPVVVSIEEIGRVSFQRKNLTMMEWNQKRDALFLELIEKVLHDRPVSSAFLIGSGFDKTWADESIVMLCNRRRVFQGENIFTKGACFAIRERIDERTLKGYLYESQDMIRCNIGMEMVIKGNSEYTTFIQAGINWYEANFECEFLLENEKEVILLLHSLEKGEKQEVVIPLEDLPIRPARATRLRLELFFVSREICKVKISDLGFGDLYPTSNRVWESAIEF
jgi:hypothetical protein